jgi:hypothetical protein
MDRFFLVSHRSAAVKLQVSTLFPVWGSSWTNLGLEIMICTGDTSSDYIQQDLMYNEANMTRTADSDKLFAFALGMQYGLRRGMHGLALDTQVFRTLIWDACAVRHDPRRQYSL